MKRLLAPLAAAALFACSGGPASSPDAGTVTEVDDATFALDGDLVMGGGDGNRTFLHLVDPETGKASPTEVPVLNTPDPTDVVAVSPDDQPIAWVSGASGSTSIIVADVAIEAGLPVFHLLRTFDGVIASRVAWTPDDDRLDTGDLWLDPTGKIDACISTGAGGPGAMMPFPESHRSACPASASLDDDGVRVADVHGARPVRADARRPVLRLGRPRAEPHVPLHFA